MEKGWTMWLSPLPLLLLGLMTPFATAQSLSYLDLVNRFIDNYNKKSISSNLFQLLVLNLQPEANNDPATPRALNFTMMETVCPKTKQHNLVECRFKKKGLVKQCSGTISLDATQPSINISCGGPEDIKSGGFLHRIIRSFANFIHQKYRILLDKYRKLQDIFSGSGDKV
ncbi:protegrin-3-like [Phascolarctos cinereus]|uniref:Protegrin-3-like n=1 Tax=Phascolarctos cinereus TaxID=38626 RepID=A0A6P5LA37_PHACI|nr:protegrin-3-like [Phascolarctos cinereus]